MSVKYLCIHHQKTKTIPQLTMIVYLLVMRTTLLTFCLLATQFILAQHDTSFIYFETGKFNFNKQAQKDLDKAVKLHEKYIIDSLYIIGHTDNRGSIEYNETLSKNRVNAVYDVLYQTFTNLRSDYKGELSPRKVNNSAKNMALNRRVEVLWFYSPKNKLSKMQRKAMQETEIDYSHELKEKPLEENKPVHKTQDVIIKQHLEDQKQFTELLEKENAKAVVVKKTIDNTQPSIIKTEKGTVLIIQEDCFVTPQGTAPKEVHVEVKEYYALSDIALGGLSTKTSKGKLLKTGGMIEVSAKDETGSDLILKKSMTVSLPTSKSKKDNKMILYEAVESKNVKNPTVWKKSKTPNYKKPFTLNKEQILAQLEKNYGSPEVILQSMIEHGVEQTINDAVDHTIKQAINYPLKKGYELVRRKHLKFKGYDKQAIDRIIKSEREKLELMQTQRYMFTATNLEKLNCDADGIQGVKGKRIIQRFNIDGGLENGYLYMLFPDKQVVCLADATLKPLEEVNAGDFLGTNRETKFSKTPEGNSVIVFGFRVRNGKFESCQKRITTSITPEHLSFKPSSLMQFKQEINALPFAL